MHEILPARSHVGEGLPPERSVGVKEARGTIDDIVLYYLWRNEDNARMATADHDRQGQAAHRQYKSRIVVEFASLHA